MASSTTSRSAERLGCALERNPLCFTASSKNSRSAQSASAAYSAVRLEHNVAVRLEPLGCVPERFPILQDGLEHKLTFGAELIGCVLERFHILIHGLEHNLTVHVERASKPRAQTCRLRGAQQQHT